MRADLRIYWTREPALVELEIFAKLISVLLLGWLWYMLLGSSGGLGTAQGYAVGAPIVIGILLWETTSKITQRQPYFRADIVWMALLIIIFLPIAVICIGVLMEPKASDGHTIVTVGLALCLLVILLALRLPALARRARTWREQRIQNRGQ